jgi:DNA-binding NarL/FixJ family response regulator
MYKTLLVGNQPIVTKVFLDVLKAQAPDGQIDVATSLEGIETAISNAYQFAVICLDAYFLDLEQVYRLLQHHPKTKVVLFTDQAGKLPLGQLYKKGIKGIIEKSAEMREIVAAIKHIYNGQTFVDAGLLMKMCSSPETSPKAAKLSPKEAIVAKLLLSGKTNIQICQHLKLSPTTVSTFKKQVFTKMGVKNILELKNELHRLKTSL